MALCAAAIGLLGLAVGCGNGRAETCAASLDGDGDGFGLLVDEHTEDGSRVRYAVGEVGEGSASAQLGGVWAIVVAGGNEVGVFTNAEQVSAGSGDWVRGFEQLCESPFPIHGALLAAEATSPATIGTPDGAEVVIWDPSTAGGASYVVRLLD